MPNRFLAGAYGFFEAAKCLLNANLPGPERWHPIYVNLCFAIELSLKGFLIFKGVPINTLKYEIGHDLEKAFKVAKEHGYIPHDEQALPWLISLLSPSHKNTSLRYLSGIDVELPEKHEQAVMIVSNHIDAIAAQMASI